MLPAFGCAIHDLVFAPNNAATRTRAIDAVRARARAVRAAHRRAGRVGDERARRAEPAARPGRLPDPRQQRDRQPRLSVLHRGSVVTCRSPTEFPVIDDRRYDDLVAEARTRIPRYTPEWTDLNDNDPGMAVVQLLAWMTELLIYRLGQVPELNYLKFLELLGIELDAGASRRASRSAFPSWRRSPSRRSSCRCIRRSRPRSRTRQRRSSSRPSARSSRSRRDSRGAARQRLRHRRRQRRQRRRADGLRAVRPRRARLGSALMLGFDSALDFPSVELDLMFWVEDRARARPGLCRLRRRRHRRRRRSPGSTGTAPNGNRSIC